MVIMPNVNEKNVQGKLQFLLNSADVLQKKNKTQVTRLLNENIHIFAELTVGEAFSWFCCSLMFLSMLANIHCAFTKSRFSSGHIVQGLSPLIVIIAFYFSVFNFTTEAWKSPALVIFMSTPFFTLHCSRIIICSVSKTRYHFLDFIHL